jgi:RNA polymerase-binding protein DksA
MPSTKKASADTKPAAKPAKAASKSATKAAAPAKKAAAKARPLDKFLEGQKKALLEERATYTRQAQSLKDEAERLAEDMEPGDVQFDEESGEGDTVNVERERDLALSAQALGEVAAIDVALEKIHNGTYGVCEKCGDPIPKERLKALPHAALCVKCKSGGLGRR